MLKSKYITNVIRENLKKPKKAGHGRFTLVIPATRDQLGLLQIEFWAAWTTELRFCLK